MLLPLQNEKITLERKIKLQSKEIEKEEKEKRLEKLRSQVRLRTKRIRNNNKTYVKESINV
jgi:hypothetical protein